MLKSLQDGEMTPLPLKMNRRKLRTPSENLEYDTGGTNYSAVDSPGGPLLGGTTYSMTGPSNMAASGLSCRKPLVIPGWAISLLMCMNGLTKRSSGHVGPPFLAVRLFSRSVGATIGQEP